MEGTLSTPAIQTDGVNPDISFPDILRKYIGVPCVAQPFNSRSWRSDMITERVIDFFMRENVEYKAIKPCLHRMPPDDQPQPTVHEVYKEGYDIYGLIDRGLAIDRDEVVSYTHQK